MILEWFTDFLDECRKRQEAGQLWDDSFIKFMKSEFMKSEARSREGMYGGMYDDRD